MASINLKDKAYSFIKRKIISCEYLPGQILIESEIIQAIGASRTPIREALNKLEQERLVRIIAKRGVFVSEITMATVYEVYDVRELVEPYLIEKNAPAISKERVDRLFADFEKLQQGESASIDQYYAFDNDLHQVFVSNNNNSYLQIMMEQIYGQNNRIRILSGRASRHRLRESQREHRVILDAIRREDYTGCALAMKEHLSIARDAALEAITKKNSVFFGVD